MLFGEIALKNNNYYYYKLVHSPKMPDNFFLFDAHFHSILSNRLILISTVVF